MARPSKAKSPKYAKFIVFEDAVDDSIPTPSKPNDDDDSEFPSELETSELVEEGEHYGRRMLLEDISEDLTSSNDTEVDNDDEEDDRRESTHTRQTSISSLPESSVFDTDNESSMPAMHKPYTPPSMRPTFRRPESVRRMQLMASPTPYERTSPRRSALHANSRTGTPRSFKQSPRLKAIKYQEEEDVEEDKSEFPLVLLHVTILPVELRWSAQSMLDILPPHVIENLQLLRSRVSETILHRGILIPHPREEYELLEERLLEALELRKERVTKCGHFRARESTSSVSSGETSVESIDSGVGSSLDGEIAERCTTCSSPVKSTSAAVDARGRKWSIKVFAANGLMRAPAWTAAWAEMERVDVEILPWISESLRKQLDAILEREEEDERRQRDDDEARMKEVVEAQLREVQEKNDMIRNRERETYAQAILDQPHSPQKMQPQALPKLAPRRSDLPQVYRTADIPLTVLLRNYVFLLAQDKRNIVMLALALLAIWTSLMAAVVRPADLALTSSCHNVLPESRYLRDNNATAALVDVSGQNLHEESPHSSMVTDEVMRTIAEPEPRPLPDAEEQTAPDGENTLSLVVTKTCPDVETKDVPQETTALVFEENIQPVCINHDLPSEIFG